MDHRVQIFDTTLRDGEQSPGISLNTTEKLEIAHQLARLGVDIIEAGFPIASPGDFEAVQAIAREVEGPVIAGLARANPADIDRAWEAVTDAARPRIHTFVSTSDIHIEHQLQSTREDVKGLARAVGRPGASSSATTSSSRRWTPRERTSSSPPRSSRSRSTRARRRSTSRTPSATRCPTSTPPSSTRAVQAGPGAAQRRALGPLPRRPRPGGRQLASPASRPARGRSSARSTASASARATRRSRRS